MSNGESTAAVASPAATTSPISGTLLKSVKFHFKKDDLGTKRPTVELALPMPTSEGLVAAVQNPKVLNFILETLGEAVIYHARQQVGDEQSPVNKQEELDLNKLTLEFIANIPPAERRGGGISKETWQEFFKDYCDVMPSITNKKREQVENAAKLFVARLQPVKTQKKILAFLKDQLALWFSSTSDDTRESLSEVYEFLAGKVEEFMKRDEAELLANL